MEDVPQSASVLTTKSTLRASRFFRKLSHFRGKFSWSRRKDDGDKSPYSQRNAQSMDAAAHAKRFMSQPVLGMKQYPPDAHRSTHRLDSQSSPSPSSSSHSPVRMSHSREPTPQTRHTTDVDNVISAPKIEGLPPPSIGNPTPIAKQSKEEAKRPTTKVLTASPSHSNVPLPVTEDGVLPIPKATSQVAAGASVAHIRSSTLPPNASNTRRRPAPHLDGLPPTQRFSLGSGFTDNERGLARLSPFVITRQAPMPIMNLPTLRPTTAPSNAVDPNSSGFRRAQSLARLRHMPALPLRGSTAEPTGAGGDDDEHDITIEDEEEEDDEEETFEDAPEGAPSEDGDGDGEGEEEELPRPSTSSAVTAESSLPPASTSGGDTPIAQDSKLLATQPKDKGKAREDPVEKTPTLANHKPDYFSTNTSGSSSSYNITPRPQLTPSWTPGGMRTVPMPWTPDTSISRARPGIYQQASRSMIDIVSPSKRDSILRDDLAQKGIDTGEHGQRRPLVRQGTSDDAGEPLSERQKRLSAAPAYDSLSHTLRRRQSLPTFNMASPPPPYPSFAPFHKTIIVPREDEGKEKLPPYTNDIYLRAVMPRKMEFSKPGVQARDRKWRRVLCELDGTVFRVYKCPPGGSGVGAFSEWWESKVGVGDVTTAGSNPPSNRAKEAEKAKSLEIGQRTKLEEEARSLEAAHSRRSMDGPTSSFSGPVRASSSTPSQMPPIMENESSNSIPRPEGNRSKLRNLLKPSRSHGRSQSEAVNSLQPRSSPSTPRSSFNETRPTGSSSLRPPPSPEPRRSTDGSKPSLVSASRSSDGATVAAEIDSSTLLRKYTLQNAESGLGNDYVKRKCVIRVRMEGEQFLLQGKDIPEVIEWIEGFQAAANIALDLDTRPMPRGPLFPRRRRRRTVAQASSTAAPA